MPDSGTRQHLRWVALLLLFLLALLPRLYSANTLGWDWDQPGSFSLVNFDEAGSCRAALDGFNYSTFVGHQTIALARLLDIGPPPEIHGNAAAVKAYCHSPGHVLVARNYSALTGALTVVMLALMGFMLVPASPAVGLTAGALLALSGFHISESHSATVDAPSVFFIYAFLTAMVYALGRGPRWLLGLATVLLVPAMWTKYWVFAGFAYLALLPERAWQYVTHGMSSGRLVAVVLASSVLLGLVTNGEFQATGWYPALALYYLVIPWRRIERPMMVFWLLVPLLGFALTRVDLIAAYTTSGAGSRFGSGYAAIGWHKWLRNLVNVPAVLIVGLGIPACFFVPAGIRTMLADSQQRQMWVCLLPVLAFALFIAFLAPVTYYRHYLALLPAAALLAACGLYAKAWGKRPWFLALFFLWPALLAVDLVGDYHSDPRRELRPWYQEHMEDRIFYSFYVNPPPELSGNSRLFQPEYAFGDAAPLRSAKYLILSENWYDTAFANELNGPLVNKPERLIKTRPEYVHFYREVIADRHPLLREEEVFPVKNFMPELLLHRQFYGTFQMFVGDIRTYKVVE
jgi:hypothetical protein